MNSQTELVILGSGTCVPSLVRSACSVMIQIGGKILVFDTGPGTMRRLLETGTSVFDIDYLFYSHHHPDHTSEFVPLIFANKYATTCKRNKPLTVIAGTGLVEFYRRLKNVYGQWIEMAPDVFYLLEMDTQGPAQKEFTTFHLSTWPMAHNPESIAFRVKDKNNKAIVYSGDTDYCESLIDAAQNADILICESALPDAQKVDGHLTPSLAGQIATQAKVKKLVLTHFYPECDAFDIESECRKTYKGPLILATDLLRLTL